MRQHSSEPERAFQGGAGEEPGCTEVFQQGASSLNIKRLLLIKRKPDNAKIRTLVLFSVKEDARVWAHLESFL